MKEHLLTTEVAKEVVNAVTDSKEYMVQLEEKYRAAVAYLEDATTNVKPIWIETLKDCTKFLNDIRLWRMAVESEVNKGIKSTTEFRDFLNTPDMKSDLSLMKDFVDVAERLKALNDSGFLDKMNRLYEVKSGQQPSAGTD